MNAATTWGLLIVFVGALATIQFVKVTGRALRRRGAWYQLIVWLLMLVIVAYPTILWGGLLMGFWLITPETGRPAVVLLLAAVLSLGILVQPTQ